MNALKRCAASYSFLQWLLVKRPRLSALRGLSIRAPSQNLCGCVREEREVNMGSSSSSYAPKTIYLDVDGKVQKVGPTSLEKLHFLDLFLMFTL